MTPLSRLTEDSFYQQHLLQRIRLLYHKNVFIKLIVSYPHTFAHVLHQRPKFQTDTNLHLNILQQPLIITISGAAIMYVERVRMRMSKFRNAKYSLAVIWFITSYLNYIPLKITNATSDQQ